MSTPYSPADYMPLLERIPAASLYINGRFVQSAAHHPVFGKADGQLICDCGDGDREALDIAVAAARAALPSWAGKAPSDRG